MDWLKNWAQGIIFAVIITVLIEMILPENSKNKKYIKVVSGIYILYTIINPLLINKDVQSFSNINNLINTNTVKAPSENTVTNTYIASLETYLKNQIENLGYKVNYVRIGCNENLSEILVIEIKMSTTNFDSNKIKDVILENYQIDSNNIKIT